MSLEPLGTLPHAVTFRKRCECFGVFFPITFGGLTMPPSWIFFQNWLVIFFCSGRGSMKAWQNPKPHRGVGQWGWQRDPSHLPWQQPAEQGAVFAHRLCRCHWRRAEKPELTASIRHDWPFPPFPPSPFCGQCLSVVSCPRCSSRRQRWENRERTGWFCIAQSLQSAKPEAWEPGIPISSSTPTQLTGSSQPPVQPAADSAPRAQEADTSDHKLILSGASATEFRNFPSVNPAGLFLLSQGFAASQSLSHL